MKETKKGSVSMLSWSVGLEMTLVDWLYFLQKDDVSQLRITVCVCFIIWWVCFFSTLCGLFASLVMIRQLNVSTVIGIHHKQKLNIMSLLNVRKSSTNCCWCSHFGVFFSFFAQQQQPCLRLYAPRVFASPQNFEIVIVDLYINVDTATLHGVHQF